MSTPQLRAIVALCAGLVLGLSLLPVSGLVRDRASWRAQELTEWCNDIRTFARSERAKMAGLLSQLSPASERPTPTGPFADLDALLSLSDSDWALHRQLSRASLRVMGSSRLFSRCAIRQLQVPGFADDSREEARRFIGYLDSVIESLPERDANDPDQYLEPVKEPERFPLL